MKEVLARQCISLCSASLLVMVSSVASAFELLSEGAMDSVAVSSGPILEAAPSDTDPDDGYETLPFYSSVQIDVADTDEVSVDLDFELVKEVEDWANNVRDRVDEQFQISTIDVLPSNEPQFDIKLDHSGIEEIGAMGDQTGDVTYQRGDYSHKSRILEASRNSITVEHSAFTERAATIDSNPYQDGSSFGDVYLTNIQASSWHRTTLRDSPAAFPLPE